MLVLRSAYENTPKSATRTTLVVKPGINTVVPAVKVRTESEDRVGGCQQDGQQDSRERESGCDERNKSKRAQCPAA